MKTVNNIHRITKQIDKTQPRAMDKMEAIACGVQARFEDSTGCFKKVTDETINIARSLGVANAEIERWAARRLSLLAQDTERIREIKSLLNKVYGSRFNSATRGMRS